MEIKGKIYRIYNTINNMSYIGQTTIDIEDRFKQHISNSKQGSHSRLHLAISKYGVDKFRIELIEECPIKDLNEKEIFYIEKFNSYIEGYNSTIGGGFCKSGSFERLDDYRNDIIELYCKSKYSTNKIAESYKVDKKVIILLLKSCGIELRNNKFSLREDETEELISKYKLGASLNQLAKEYSTSSSTIKKFLNNHNVDTIDKDFILKDPKRCTEIINTFENTTLKTKEILDMYHINFSTFKKIIGNRGRKKKYIVLPKNKEIEIVLKYREGYSISSLRKEYNIHYRVIKRILNKYNI